MTRQQDGAVGWIRGRTIGFRGFASESDAARAAWVAYATATRPAGGDPIRAAVEPLGLAWRGGRERILAGDEEIGRLLRPGAGSRGGDSFAFEIEVPGPADEAAVRSMAHRIYLALGRSPIRRPARDARTNSPSTRGGTTMDTAYSHRPLGPSVPDPVHASLPPPAGSPPSLTFVTWILLVSIAIVAGLALIASAPLSVTIPLGTIFLTYVVAALVVTGIERLGERRRRRGRGMASGVGMVAALSVALLGAAFVAPERFRVPLAASGLAGLFVVRITASAAGWIPRGAIRAKPRPAEPSLGTGAGEATDMPTARAA